MIEVKQKILIIEDDLDVLGLLNTYFCALGYDVFCVSRGEQGVSNGQNLLPDIVILDIGLPDIDGYEVARRLRSNRRTAGIPILFLTDKRERSDRLFGLELGADDYIPKPFDLQELGLRVRNAIHRTEQNSLTNPVTGLPDGKLVDERLSEFLYKHPKCMLIISLENMDVFRESYGFLASDDVLRVVAVMVQNAMKDLGCENDFLGHLGPTTFLVMTEKEHAVRLQEMINSRLERSLDFFYPIKDRGYSDRGSQRIFGRIVILQENDGHFSSPEDLRASLLRKK